MNAVIYCKEQPVLSEGAVVVIPPKLYSILPIPFPSHIAAAAAFLDSLKVIV